MLATLRSQTCHEPAHRPPALLALIPARDKTFRLHEWLTQAMGVGMMGLAYTFCLSTHGVFADIELVLAVAATLAGALTFAAKKHFLF